jgi:hypothetical protein
VDPVEDVDEPRTARDTNCRISVEEGRRKDINQQSKMIIGNVYKCFKTVTDN